MTSAPERFWFPEDLLDEDLPPGRDSAEAWVSLPEGFEPEDHPAILRGDGDHKHNLVVLMPIRV